jgi:hypothetical protein
MSAPDPPREPAELSPSAVDPLNPPSQDDPPRPSTREISPARRELISIYAAANPALRRELAIVDPDLRIDVDRPLDALLNLLGPDGSARPPISPIQVAFATMTALGREHRDEPQVAHDFGPLAGVLLRAPLPAGPEPRALVESALRRAASPEVDDRKRWEVLRSILDAAMAPELRKVHVAWCRSGLRSLRNEYVSRVETRLVVEAGETALDDLALAVLPDNWSHCNDFFCSLTRRSDRDGVCAPPTTGGNLSTAADDWRGVYEERVGTCPAGWFPDTYLLFTWTKTAQQVILRYELAPAMPGDRTVLRIDEGYIQVDRVGPNYEVSTIKYLLFDDRFLPSGGQALGQAACQLGWLDYCVNQFTNCAHGLAGGEAVGAENGGNGGGMDAGIRDILKQCEGNIVESVNETDAQVKRMISQIREGKYGLDAGVIDAGQFVERAIRDGARSIVGHADLVKSYLALVSKLTGREDN